MKTTYELFFKFKVDEDSLEQGGKITVTTPSPISSDQQLQLMESEISKNLGVIDVTITDINKVTS